MVEPIAPFQCRVFQSIEAAQPPAFVNDPGFKEAIDRFRQSIDQEIPNAANRWGDLLIGRPFGAFDR